KSFVSANPKSPVARGGQAPNVVGWKTLSGRRLPGDSPDAIEPKQGEIRPQPEIAVGRLSNCVNLAFGKAVANPPSRVGILTDVQRRIERQRARTRHQQDASQHKAQRQSLPSSVPAQSDNTSRTPVRSGKVSSSGSLLHSAHILAQQSWPFLFFLSVNRAAMMSIISMRI